LEEEALGEAYLRPRGVARVQRRGLRVQAWRTAALPNRAILLSELVAASDGPPPPATNG
jgi:hypothetical protein